MLKSESEINSTLRAEEVFVDVFVGDVEHNGETMKGGLFSAKKQSKKNRATPPKLLTFFALL